MIKKNGSGIAANDIRYSYSLQEEDGIGEYSLVVGETFTTKKPGNGITFMVKPEAFTIGDYEWSMMVERNTASASMTVGLKCLEPQEVITHFTISLFGACGDPYGSESGSFNFVYDLWYRYPFNVMPLSLKKKGCSFHEELTIVLNMRVSGVDNEYCTVLRQGNYGIYTLHLKDPSNGLPKRIIPSPFRIGNSTWELALLFNDHSELSRKSLELILISLNLNRFLNVKYVVVLNQRGFTNRSKTTTGTACFSFRVPIDITSGMREEPYILTRGPIIEEKWMTIEIRMVVSNALRSTLDNSYGFVNILTNANIVDPLDLRTIKLDPSVVRFPLSLPISSLPEKIWKSNLWLCMECENDGSLVVGKFLKDKEIEGICLGDVCSLNGDRPSVTVYSYTSKIPPKMNDNLLVFCKFLHTDHQQFVDAVLLNHSDPCVTMFGKLYDLVQKELGRKEPAFYLEEEPNELCLISALFKPIYSICVQQGSVIVVGPLGGENLRGPLGARFSVFRGDLPACIICLENPQTHGFLHNKSCHRCVCFGCGKKLIEEMSRCPVCRKRIEDLVQMF